jgi:polyadenylate-binding protein 2
LLFQKLVASKKEEQRSDCDARSIYVKNVDYKTEVAELKEHFASCGQVARVTLFRDQVTGHPLGYGDIARE